MKSLTARRPRLLRLLAWLLTVGFFLSLATDADARRRRRKRRKPRRAKVAFQMAFRAGFNIPFGWLDQQSPINDEIGITFPVQADLGVRYGNRWLFGGYVGVFAGQAGERLTGSCKREGGGCVALGARLGAQVQFHLLPKRQPDVWLGYGIGASMFYALNTGETRSEDGVTAYSFDFARATIGVEWYINRTFALGPYVTVAMGTVFFAAQDSARFGFIDRPLEGQWFHGSVELGTRLLVWP